MSELLSQLFTKYGVRALLGVLTLFVVIWVVAHQTAAPGGTVSVLWGLVQYTKALEGVAPTSVTSVSSASTGEKPATAKDQFPTNAGLFTGSELAVVAHNVSASTVDALLTSLRERRGLRRLSALESDRGLDAMPVGTFGYVRLFGISEPEADLYRRAVRVQGYQLSPAYLEVHRLGHGPIAFLGFTSESDASKLVTQNRAQDITIVLSATPWESLTSLVSIPIDRLKASDERDLQVSPKEYVRVFDVTIK